MTDALLSLVVALLATIALVAGTLVVRLRLRLAAMLIEQRDAHETAVARLTGLLESVARAQNEVRFRARLLNAVGQAAVAVDLQGRIVYCNRVAAALFDRDVRDLVGAALTDIMPETDPAPGQKLADRLRDGLEWTGELSVQSPDGTEVPILATDSPLHDEHNQLIGMVRIATDLTARKKAEQASRLLADASAALAASLDYESTIRAVSNLAVPALADACVVDMLGDDRRLWRIETAHVSPDKARLARELRRRYPLGLDDNHPISDVIRSGRPRLIEIVADPLLRALAHDDEHFRILRELDNRSAMILPLTAAGETLGAISFFTSESGRTYDAADLELAQELARRAALAVSHARLYETAVIANQAKSDFLAVMSHELRTPLTTVMGYTDLLLTGLPEPISPRAKVYVERIRSAAWHLLGLIEQILIYTRLDIGREELHPERLSIPDLLADAAALIEPVAAERGIGFTVDPTGLPEQIETDFTKARQILLNLLANAVKFTEHGEVRLSARLQGDRVLITVEDTGIGIRDEHLEKVFEPFWQVDQSATRAAGGTGLGLTVSRRLARALGGDITVSSQPGKGTVFSVELPARWSGRSEASSVPRGLGALVR